MKFKYNIFFVFICCFSLLGFSCKKFLNVNPNNSLSGNNFWQSSGDFEKFTSGLYESLRNYTCKTTAFFNVTGEFRFNNWDVVSGQNIGGNNFNAMMGYLQNNQLRNIFSSSDSWYGSYGYANVANWNTFYDIIQSCNILQYQINNVADGILTQREKDNYNGEAIFMRNLIYFLMVRIYGDVPYYTDAFISTQMTRMSMTQVVNNCIADLKSTASVLPWSLLSSNSNFYGSRGSRAAVYALIMNLDMWNATFDPANKTTYYNDVDSIGNILITQNEGMYELVPMNTLEQSQNIFRGFTKESLFCIPSNTNAGETFSTVAKFSSFVLAGVDLNPANPSVKSTLFYDRQILNNKLFPNQNDNRYRIWFRDATNAEKTDGTFQFYKFYNIDPVSGGSSDSKILFRMADAVLLRAEALNQLGKVDEATSMLNMVKNRAGVPNYTPTSGDGSAVNSDLESEIIWERLREFIGEGSYFYDIVRTKAIVNSKFFETVMSTDDFNLRAWTWPLSNDVRTQNPNITLNSFWQ